MPQSETLTMITVKALRVTLTLDRKHSNTRVESNWIVLAKLRQAQEVEGRSEDTYHLCLLSDFHFKHCWIIIRRGFMIKRYVDTGALWPKGN